MNIFLPPSITSRKSSKIVRVNANEATLGYTHLIHTYFAKLQVQCILDNSVNIKRSVFITRKVSLTIICLRLMRVNKCYKILLNYKLSRI